MFFLSPYLSTFLCLSLCIGKSAMTPCYVALWCRCLKGVSGEVSQITWTMCSRNVFCVSYMYSPIVESWMLLVHFWVGLTFSLADCKDRSSSQYMSCSVGTVSWAGVVSSRFWCLPRSLFGCSTYVVRWGQLCCVLNSSTSCVGSGSTWLGFQYRLMSDTTCKWANCLGYHTIHCLWLPLLLVLDVHGKGPVVYKV